MATVERVGPADRERVLAIRLRALSRDPDAFGALYEEERARPPEVMRERLANSRHATFVAATEGEDVGLASGAPWAEREGTAGLFAMWVAPATRGRAVGDQLAYSV